MRSCKSEQRQDLSNLIGSIQFGIPAGGLAAGFDNVTVAPAPLPAAAWLMLSALGGVGAWARRKRTNCTA
jgi:hypothetical protein